MRLNTDLKETHREDWTYYCIIIIMIIIIIIILILLLLYPSKGS